MKLSVKYSGVDEMRRELASMANRASAQQREKMLRGAGRMVVQNVLPQRFRAGGPGWMPVSRDGRGAKPLQDQGALKAANDFRVEGGTLVVGNTMPYSRLQNEGGTVNARPGHYLAIPIAPPLSRTQRLASKPRDFKNTFFLRSKDASGRPELLLMQKTGKKKARAIFRLVKSVTVKARPFLYWDRETLEKIGRLWTRFVGKGELRE